jgi:DNA-binding response OmpR family regulator
MKGTMKTILSVDDEPDVLKCIQMALEVAGYKSLTSDHPEEAMSIIRKNDVALLTLDVRMPKMNGFTLYEELKKTNKESVPVLFITAYPTSFSVDSNSVVKMWEDDFADGDTDILYKPFDIDSLVEKVESLIGPAGDDEE